MAARRTESFPEACADIVRAAARDGSITLTFASAEECTRERLRLYRFFAALRANQAHELHAAVANLSLQKRAMYGERTQRILHVVYSDALRAAMQTTNEASAELEKSKARDEAVAELLKQGFKL
jgi:hypothetical protein